ncbi:MAG: zinc-ribbon domain-containing protein [Magnetococcales bacterium]|nr:zinc-ribbon domain-containing protein [Magnetococcales bacterium]
MIIVCPNCNTRFEVNERQAGPGLRKMRCAFCQHTFYKEIEAPPDYDPKEEANPEDNPELLGTLLLNLWNKPKKPEKPGGATKERKLSSQDRSLPQVNAPPEVLATPGEEGDTPYGGSHGLRRVVLSDLQKAGMLYKTRWAATALSWDDMKIIAPYWEAFKAAEGVRIFREGDRNPFLCVIFLGEVKLDGPGVPALDAGGKAGAVTLGGGDSFGELSILANAPRSATATAIKESYFLVMTKKRLREMAERDPLMWQSFLKILIHLMCRHIQEKEGKLLDCLIKV